MKINIEAKLNNEVFKGKGIKKNNQIIYKDKNILTKITLDNIITIEREEDYYIKINLKKGIKLAGTYITKYGNINIETLTSSIFVSENEIKITYKLYVDKHYIDTIQYNLKFSLDTHI